MSTVTRLITAEELFAMPENGGRCELVDGEIVTMEPPGAMHGWVAVRLTTLLGRFVMDNDLGAVFTETGFITARNPDRVLSPDGAFVPKSRIEAIGIPKAYFPEAPALIVKVISPEDTVNEVGDKIERWFQGGVELAWVVDPKQRTVTVYKSFDDIQILTAKDHLTGEYIVPGFDCSVADLFPGS